MDAKSSKPLKEPVPAPTAVVAGENEEALIRRVFDLERRIAQLERGVPEGNPGEPAPTGQPPVPAPAVGVQDLQFVVKQLDERIACLELASTEGAVSLRRHLLGIVSFIENQHNL